MNTYSLVQVADILSVSKSNVSGWERNKKLVPSTNPSTGEKEYTKAQLVKFDQANAMFNTKWDDEKKVSPAQKQTERCHPEETRPLTVREYARVQAFPDNWEFMGSMGQQYKQIGNDVPVNLSCALGRSVVKLLNDIYKENLSIDIKSVVSQNILLEVV